MIKHILFLFFLNSITFAEELHLNKCNHHSTKSHKDFLEKKHFALPHLRESHLNIIHNRSQSLHHKSLEEISVQLPSEYKIGFKLLIISASLDPEEDGATLDLIKNVLIARGIPFKVLLLSENGIKKNINLKDFLYDENQNPKFYGIITTSDELLFKKSDEQLQMAFDDHDWAILQQYEELFSVRRVSMFSYPKEEIGVEEKPYDDHTKNINLSPSEKSKELDPSLKKDAQILLQYSWYYFAKIKDLKSSTPFVFYNRKERPSDENVAGVIVSYPNDRQQMHFFFSQNIWNRGSKILSNIWINWITKGLYIGKRRMYLNPQVDDFYLSTDLWQNSDGNKNVLKIHRIKKDDFLFHVEWQKEFRKKISNPEFRIELAFNGKGAVDRVKENNRDYLYDSSLEFMNEFFWTSHTYSHADLNFISYENAYSEFKNNILFSETLKSLGPKYYSETSLVPPRISGLFNGQALEAMTANNIKFVVGDNSRTELKPKHPYTARITKKSVNGHDGILIIPRHATEVYYNTSNPTELTEEYNHLYLKELNKLSSFEDIYLREVERVSDSLFSFDHAPYMFHQSNMNVFDYKGSKTSLLTKWLDDIVYHVRKISNLPIENIKMDQLGQDYVSRIQFNNCQFHGLLSVKNRKVTSLEISSLRNCLIPITSSIPLINEGKKMNPETYGPDTTYYLNAKQEGKALIKLNQ